MLGPHTIVRLRAAMVLDAYSGELTQAAWDDPDNPPTEVTQTGCSVQPGAPKELLADQREGVVIDYSIWAPLTLDVTELDRIRWNGVDYRIEATIQRWEFTPGHLVIPIRRVEG